MSYTALPLSIARAFQPQVDPDEIERQRRIKLAALAPDQAEASPRSMILPQRGQTMDDWQQGETVKRAASGIVAPPAYGGDSSLPPRAVQGGDSSLPAMNAPSRVIQPAAASASPNTIPMSALRAPAPADGQANFERITAPRATMPVAESNAPRLTAPPDGMHVDMNAHPMSALQAPSDGMGYGEVNSRAANNPYSSIAPGRAQQELERMHTAGPHKAGGWERAGRAILDVLTGNPIGAGAEIFAPGYMARQRFERSDLPMAQRNAQIEQGMQTQRVGDMSRIASETGTLPSGEMTEPARVRLQRQHELESQHDIANALRAQSNATAERRADTGAQSLDWRKEYGQKRLHQHQQGLDNGSHQLVKGMTGDGKVGWFSVNKADASDVVQVADANGQPLQTPDAMLEGGRNYRAQQAQAGANQRAAGTQAGADRRAAGRNSINDDVYQRLVKEGKINPDTGLAENPSWRSAYDSAFNSQKEHMGADDETAKKKATAFANAEVKGGQYIPYTKLPEFQGYKGAAKAKGSQPRAGQSAQADHTGYIAGKSTQKMKGKDGEMHDFVYRGVNPSNGKLKWERVN